MNSLITLNNIHLQYQNGSRITEVIKGVSLDIKNQETLAIVGKSGSGKTSLIMLMAGLEKTSSGSIIFQNKTISQMTENELSHYRQKNVGIIFQSFYLIPNYTALENVALSLEIDFQPNSLGLAKDLLIKLGLGHRLEHYPSQLSGGEQQRVAIARAVINKPSIILADEPTGNLDDENSLLISQTLFDVVKSHGSSLCLVTHDKELAQRCDRQIIIQDGQLI
jgi:putative ABC transport system ATP-binding protein